MPDSIVQPAHPRSLRKMIQDACRTQGQESVFINNGMDLMNEDNPDGDRKPVDESSDADDYDGNDFDDRDYQIRSADINNVLKTILSFPC